MRRRQWTAQKKAVDKKGIRDLFDRWADEPELMTIEGIGNMASDLGMDPETDVRVLALCWKIGAKRPAQIDHVEWATGLETLQCDSFERLKELIPNPDEFDLPTFKRFFKFVFLFSREGTHKTIEKDLVAALLPIAIGGRSQHTTLFLQFLEQSSTSRVTLDQWCSFLEFSDKVSVDFDGYEEDGAWPLLIDEYVEYAKLKHDLA